MRSVSSSTRRWLNRRNTSFSDSPSDMARPTISKLSTWLECTSLNASYNRSGGAPSPRVLTSNAASSNRLITESSTAAAPLVVPARTAAGRSAGQQPKPLHSDLCGVSGRSHCNARRACGRRRSALRGRPCPWATCHGALPMVGNVTASTKPSHRSGLGSDGFPHARLVRPSRRDDGRPASTVTKVFLSHSIAAVPMPSSISGPTWSLMAIWSVVKGAEQLSGTQAGFGTGQLAGYRCCAALAVSQNEGSLRYRR